VRIPPTPSVAFVLCLGAFVFGPSLPALRAANQGGTSAGAGASVRFDSLPQLFARDAPVSLDRVKFTRKDTTSVPCAFHPGRTMLRISLEFVSQKYRGIEARHRANLFVPEPAIPDRARGCVAIILGGDGLGGSDAEHDWVESIAAGLGVPCLVVLESFSKEEFGVRNLGQLMSQGEQAFAETGDPREAGYYALARIFSAAATVAAAIPEVQGKRFVATGSSKGGMAAIITLAGDSRFVGAYPTAWNMGNIKEATRLKGERWGWDVKPKETGPAGESAREIWQRFGDGRFQNFLDLFETDRWGDLLKGKFVMPAVGANDPLFHLLSDQSYIGNLKATWALLRVPNFGHGRGTPDHALGWRHTVAAAFLGQRTPGVRLDHETVGERTRIHLSVAQAGNEPIKDLRLYSTTDPVGDYRNAKWEITSIATSSRLAGGRTVVAETSMPTTGTIAYFARAVFEGEFCEAINCSNVVEVGAPVIQRLEPRQ
jgi:hypothetical protein